jgi:hypothetical protein
MYIASSLMGIGEALKKIMSRLEVLESRSSGKKNPLPPPEGFQSAVLRATTTTKATGRREGWGSVGGKTIAHNFDSGPSGDRKKRKPRKKKGLVPSVGKGTPAPPSPIGEQKGQTEDDAVSAAQAATPREKSMSWVQVVKRGKGRGKKKNSGGGEVPTPQSAQVPPPSASQEEG